MSDEVMAATAAKWRRRAKNQRRVFKAMLSLMKRIEWSGVGQPYDTGGREPVCPVCYVSRWQEIHRPDCDLRALITELEIALDEVKPKGHT